MVDRFLAGSSLRNLARSLNVEGVKPPRMVFYEEALAKGYRAKLPVAESWSYVAVRGVLTAPALAALISHKGLICQDQQGEPIVAGKGIVTVDERELILAELRRRSATRRSEGLTEGGEHDGDRRSPKYLLTGFGRCGECGKALQRIVTARGGVYYRCASKGRGQMCRGGIIAGKVLESEVTRRCAERLQALAKGSLLDKLDVRHLATGPWEHLRVAQGRALLSLVLREVWVYSADVPVAERIHIVWVGESSPPPRGKALGP
jgi:Recombinase zinc beta ribbon domain